MSDKPSITRVVKFIKKGERGGSVIVADTPSRHYTYAQWQTYGATGHLETWGSINNADKFRVGDTIVINGVCTDKGNIGVSLYATVGAVNVENKSVTATTTSLIMGGEDGKPGSNAVTYEFVMTDTYYRVDAKGIVSARLKGTLYQIVGGARTPISGAALTFGYTNPGYDKDDHPTTSTSINGTFSDDDWFTGDEYADASMCNKSSSIFVCYGDINAPKAIFTVAVVFDGSNGNDGDKGDRGPALRGPQDWEKLPVGFSFQAGGDNEEWKDVVVYNGIYASCIKSHTKTATNFPGSTQDTQNGYWVITNKWEIVATNLLLATYALIKNLGVENVEIKGGNGSITMTDSSGNILFQAKNGNVTCNTGTFKNVAVDGNITSRLLRLPFVNINAWDVPDKILNPLEYGCNLKLNNGVGMGVDSLELPANKYLTGIYLRVYEPFTTRSSVETSLSGKFAVGNDGTNYPIFVNKITPKPNTLCEMLCMEDQYGLDYFWQIVNTDTCDF